MKLVHWFFSTWNWFRSRKGCMPIYVSGTCCVLIFVHETCFLLIFYRREICILIFLLVKLILLTESVACRFFFLELVVCWFLLLKLVLCWFFFLWNLYNDFSHRKTDFLHETYCVLIFVQGACCVLIFFRGIYFTLSFVRETCFILILLSIKLLHWFCSWNFFENFCNFETFWFETLLVDVSIQETCTLIFFHRETAFVYGTCCLLRFFSEAFAWYFAYWRIV